MCKCVCVCVCEEFQYLESIVSSACTLDSEICSRISKASKSFTYLSRILWYKRKIKLATKLGVLKAVVLPTLLYGSETWASTVSQLQRLQSFVMRCLRIILRVSVCDKLRNVEIRARAGVRTVESMIRRRRLQWVGHLSRMDLSRVPQRLMVCCSEGGKPALLIIRGRSTVIKLQFSGLVHFVAVSSIPKG